MSHMFARLFVRQEGFTFLLCAEGAALLINVSAAVSEADEGCWDSSCVPIESFHLLK